MKGNASTAVAGVFSGQLFNFLIGFAGSFLIQSLDGEFEFVIFAFQGNTFDVLSDSIVIVVLVSGLALLLAIFVIVWRTR